MVSIPLSKQVQGIRYAKNTSIHRRKHRNFQQETCDNRKGAPGTLSTRKVAGTGCLTTGLLIE